MFGIFSEEIISIWYQHERCVYSHLGRPRVRTDAASQPYTLDFTLQNRKSGKIFISEMKCEIEYRNFKYFVLQDASQRRCCANLCLSGVPLCPDGLILRSL